MNDLNIQIRQIELSIQSNLKRLTELKTSLTDKASSISFNLALSEMLALGFSIGYVLTPNKRSKSKISRFVLAIVLLKSRKIARQVVSYLLGNQNK